MKEYTGNMVKYFIIIISIIALVFVGLYLYKSKNIVMYSLLSFEAQIKTVETVTYEYGDDKNIWLDRINVTFTNGQENKFVYNEKNIVLDETLTQSYAVVVMPEVDIKTTTEEVNYDEIENLDYLRIYLTQADYDLLTAEIAEKGSRMFSKVIPIGNISDEEMETLLTELRTPKTQ